MTALLDVLPQDIITLDLTATQFEFSQDPARHVWLEGSAGEGKTFGAIAALFTHRTRMVDWYHQQDPEKPVRPMQVAIVRDTHVNIRMNTVKSIQRAMPGLFSFRDNMGRMFQRGVDIAEMNAWYEKPVGDPPSWLDCNLFGLDDLASLDRIQGGEYDLIWMEEPSPILSTGNNGIREEVFLVCAARLRGGESPKRLQVTMNPGDEEHWTSRQQDDPLPSTSIYRIRKGENKHFSDFDRVMTQKAYAGRADLTARFVEGKRAKVYDGVAVVPEFKELQHMAHEWILPDPALEVIRMYDGGLHPSVILGQITASGRLFLLDSLVGQNMGMTQLIENKLKYVLGRPRYQRVKKWRDCGDPSLINREQSDSDHTASKIIETLLKTTYEPGVSSWEVRREALKWLCTQAPGGVPMLQISPRISEGEKINWIKNGLAGGYSYRVTADGRVLRDIPDKNLFCVDDETEMLTLDGWKRRDRLIPGEAVYSYNLDLDELVVSRLVAIHSFPGLHRVHHFTGQAMDMMVTPEHQCLVGHRWKKGIRLVATNKLNASDHFLRTAYYRGQRKPWYSDDFVRLCAWIMTEGTYGSGRSGAVTICQSLTYNAPYCKDIDALVERFHGRKKTLDGEMEHWQLSGEMADLIHAVMPEKYPTMAFIHRMTNIQRRLFLYEAIRGDGTWHKFEGHLPSPVQCLRTRDFFLRSTTPRIFQKSEQAITALQTLCVLAGLRGVIHPKKAGCDGWSLSITRQGRWTTVSNLSKQDTTVPMVWCPQTPEHTWVARRKGHVFLTGNSHPCDALSHVVAHIWFQPKEKQYPKPQPIQRQRAKGYGVGA